jgi:hypothetical protein
VHAINLTTQKEFEAPLTQTLTRPETEINTNGYTPVSNLILVRFSPI